MPTRKEMLEKAVDDAQEVVTLATRDLANAQKKLEERHISVTITMSFRAWSSILAHMKTVGGMGEFVKTIEKQLRGR